jgi:hypothetical protein
MNERGGEKASCKQRGIRNRSGKERITRSVVVALPGRTSSHFFALHDQEKTQFPDFMAVTAERFPIHCGDTPSIRYWNRHHIDADAAMAVVLARYEGARGLEWAIPGLIASSGQGIDRAAAQPRGDIYALSSSLPVRYMAAVSPHLASSSSLPMSTWAGVLRREPGMRVAARGLQALGNACCLHAFEDSLGLSLNRKRILSAGPYLRAACGPQSKGVGQWQLKHAMQGEFAAK